MMIQTSMKSDYIHQLQKPTSHHLTRTLMCPKACLQGAVSQSKKTDNILMSLADLTLHLNEK